MPDFLVTFHEFLQSTQVPQQIREVDAGGLFTNPYFLVPFLGAVIYLLFKKSITSLMVLGVFTGLWLFSGSPAMQNLVVNGELQMNKVLPVAGIGVLAIAVLVYLLFIRD